MARQEIPLGDAPSGVGGDNAREAFTRVNQMTAELYGRVESLEGDKVGTSDPRLSDAREWTAATVPQAEAEAGTGTTRRAWTAQRVWQAAAAWWVASAMKTKLDGIEIGAQVNPAAASQAEAEAGSGTAIRSWTSQRIWQAIAAWWNASAMKTKLDGVAAGATANATDAQLRDRSTHTGTQLAATIGDLAAAVRAVTLTGISSSSAAITSGDTVLSALGKAMGSFANALPRPTTTDAVTLFADTATVSGWYDKLLGGPYTARQTDHPDGAIPAGTYDEVNYYWVLNITYAGNVLQAAFPYVSAAGTGRERIKFRLKGGSTWTAWQPLTAGAVTRSAVDTTAGRLLRAGDGGWMGDVPVVTGSTNLDDRTIRGLRYWSTSETGTPPAGASFGFFNTFGFTGTSVLQEFWEISTTTALGRKWRRNCYGSGAWSSWKETNAPSEVIPDIGESFINSPSLASGRYRVVAGSNGYLPLGSNGYLDHYSMGGSNAKQEYTPFYNARTFIRIYNSGGWSPWSEVSLATPYVSAEQTITAGGTINLTHGLGAIPRIVRPVFVCKVAEFGHVVGEEIDATYESNGSNYNYMIAATSTTLRCVCGSNGFAAPNASGAFQALTQANWSLVVRAWL